MKIQYFFIDDHDIREMKIEGEANPTSKMEDLIQMVESVSSFMDIKFEKDHEWFPKCAMTNYRQIHIMLAFESRQDFDLFRTMTVADTFISEVVG